MSEADKVVAFAIIYAVLLLLVPMVAHELFGGYWSAVVGLGLVFAPLVLMARKTPVVLIE